MITHPSEIRSSSEMYVMGISGCIVTLIALAVLPFFQSHLGFSSLELKTLTVVELAGGTVAIGLFLFCPFKRQVEVKLFLPKLKQFQKKLPEIKHEIKLYDGPSYTEIVDDVLVQIFSYVPLYQVFKLMEVCKGWKRIFDEKGIKLFYTILGIKIDPSISLKEQKIHLVRESSLRLQHLVRSFKESDIFLEVQCFGDLLTISSDTFLLVFLDNKIYQEIKFGAKEYKIVTLNNELKSEKEHFTADKQIEITYGFDREIISSFNAKTYELKITHFKNLEILQQETLEKSLFNYAEIPIRNNLLVSNGFIFLYSFYHLISIDYTSGSSLKKSKLSLDIKGSTMICRVLASIDDYVVYITSNIHTTHLFVSDKKLSYSHKISVFKTAFKRIDCLAIFKNVFASSCGKMISILKLNDLKNNNTIVNNSVITAMEIKDNLLICACSSNSFQFWCLTSFSLLNEIKNPIVGTTYFLQSYNDALFFEVPKKACLARLRLKKKPEPEKSNFLARLIKR